MYYAKDLRKGDTFKLNWWRKMIQIIQIQNVHVMLGVECAYCDYLLITDISQVKYAIHPDTPVEKMMRLPKKL